MFLLNINVIEKLLYLQSCGAARALRQANIFVRYYKVTTCCADLARFVHLNQRCTPLVSVRR